MASVSAQWSPSSSTATLASTTLPHKAFADNLYQNPRIQVTQVVEFISASPKNSSSVYVYDVAEQVGFGTLTKNWATEGLSTAPVFDLQTRPGAGLALVGRLSQGTSHDTLNGAVLTAYTTPAGLASMAPSFAHLPSPTSTSRLIVQVPAVTPVGESLNFSPTLSPLASVWSILPSNVAVLLSATPQQAIDFASLAYSITDSHVVHVFDHFGAGRETGRTLQPPASSEKRERLQDGLRRLGYSYFDYHGDASAHTVFVLANGPLAQAFKSLVNVEEARGLGVVIVNVIHPWDEESFSAIIPTTATSVHVLDDVPNAVTQGITYSQAFSSLWSAGPKRTIKAHRIVPTQGQELLTNPAALVTFISKASGTLVHSASVTDPAKKILFFGAPGSALSPLPLLVEELFGGMKGVALRGLADHDVFSKAGGITATRLLLSRRVSKNELPAHLALPLESGNGVSDFLGILDHTLLKTHSVLHHAKPGSTVLLVAPWTAAEFEANVPSAVLAQLVERSISVYLLDAKGLAKSLSPQAGAVQDAVQNLVVDLAFLRLYLGPAASEETILALAKYVSVVPLVSQDVPLQTINSAAWTGLKAFVSSGNLPSEGMVPSKHFSFSAIAVDAEEGKTVVNGARLSSWHDAAKHLLFPAIYSPHDVAAATDADAQQNPALRPEVADRTYLVTCTVNKRLTPLEYDRNVFHLEFDTTGTGLKYAIGEALGVHGWNDEQEVLDFCASYGVDPNRLITIPVPGDDTKVHTRTVLQALQQQIDLFGKPPKSFYTDLAEYATNAVDRYALRFIGSPEGSSTFKKLSEKDTVSFAEVLEKYPSARPGIERLCELVGDIKPRHYSIASAQEVVGDRVDLLVVTVDWQTPTGATRYGQCTRYLAGLKVGQRVTVSIKPSVMKLPPSPKQPLIMAGLGTGAAPFRAFLQLLAKRAAEGQELGPVYYYFGSRYQSAEYLYGEEIEAFILDGVITRAGLAFSRDGAKKVYIQHKMLEDSEALARMLYEQEGAFYLCGPTWPVPDVYEALVNALVKYKSLEPEQAGEYIESLKEEERYVLEVY